MIIESNELKAILVIKLVELFEIVEKNAIALPPLPPKPKSGKPLSRSRHFRGKRTSQTQTNQWWRLLKNFKQRYNIQLYDFPSEQIQHHITNNTELHVKCGIEAVKVSLIDERKQTRRHAEAVKSNQSTDITHNPIFRSRRFDFLIMRRWNSVFSEFWIRRNHGDGVTSQNQNLDGQGNSW